MPLDAHRAPLGPGCLCIRDLLTALGQKDRKAGSWIQGIGTWGGGGGDVWGRGGGKEERMEERGGGRRGGEVVKGVQGGWFLKETLEN